MASVLVAAAVAAWLGAGVRLAVTDLRTGRLPTRLIWPAAGIVWLLYAVASLIEAEPDGLIGAAVGAAVCGAIMAAVHFIHPSGLGFGDVRLSVLNGLLCGWWGWDVAVWGLAAGFALAVPEALVVLVRHGRSASRPLGPYPPGRHRGRGGLGGRDRRARAGSLTCRVGAGCFPLLFAALTGRSGHGLARMNQFHSPTCSASSSKYWTSTISGSR